MPGDGDELSHRPGHDVQSGQYGLPRHADVMRVLRDDLSGVSDAMRPGKRDNLSGGSDPVSSIPDELPA